MCFAGRHSALRAKHTTAKAALPLRVRPTAQAARLRPWRPVDRCAKKVFFAYELASSVNWYAKRAVFAYDLAITADWCAKRGFFAHGGVAHEEDLLLVREEGG